ncbi:MAG: PilN domain-containing protein [Nitrosomonas sp.]|nr:MAG: PilN domain-containing protein [Nitrosomonas sp.]
MIRINLLPHRELKRKARQRQIAMLAGLVGLLGIVVVFGIYAFIDSAIEDQNGRNQYLNEQIILLDKEILEIKDIRAKIQELLARKQVVEALQSSRLEAVHLLDQLVRLLPDGVYLQSIKQEGDVVTLIGYAQTNARISVLMRNIESSLWLQSPLLVEIKAATVNNTRQNEFHLKIKLRRADDAG